MNTVPTTYTIRVEGHLDDHWSAWLGGLDITRDDDGATTVTVQVADQAQLHGVLAGLRDIGAVISELRLAGAGHREPDAELGQLGVVDHRRRPGEQVRAAGGLRKRDRVADRVAPA
jgi:hypothetical protein